MHLFRLQVQTEEDMNIMIDYHYYTIRYIKHSDELNVEVHKRLEQSRYNINVQKVMRQNVVNVKYDMLKTLVNIICVID